MNSPHLYRVAFQFYATSPQEALEIVHCGGLIAADAEASREWERAGQANELPKKEQAEYDHKMSVAYFGGHFSDRK